MKKFHRIISSFVLFAFFLSVIGVDSSLSLGMTGATHGKNEIKTLSPILKFSDLAGIEPKEMVRVEMAIESALLFFADGCKEINAKDLIEYANDYCTYSSVFDDTHIFFAEREVLDNGRIKVMARVHVKKGEEKTRLLRTYYAVFSTKKENGGFDVRAYKEKEWDENKKIIRQGKSLPKRETQKPEDAKAMARHKNDNAKTIDNFIEECIYDGNFAEIEGRTSEDLWGLRRVLMINPSVYFAKEYMEYIEDQLKWFLKNFGTDVKTALDGKNLVFLRVPEGANYPVIYEKDSLSGKIVPVQVMSHTSENAVYVFLREFLFDSLKEKKQWVIIQEHVLPRMIYEIGVIYGLKYRVIDPGLTMNDLLEARQMDRHGVSAKEIKESFPNLELEEKVNLDETLWTRDYAMGGREQRSEEVLKCSFLKTTEEVAGINVLKEYADKVGELIAPPVSRYTLFTAYDLAKDEEYEKDAKRYKSRFKLERIPTDKPEEIIDKILRTMSDKRLRPENVIVQLPAEFSRGRYGIDKLITNAAGIKVMIIDTKGLKEEKDEKARERYRDIVYSIMRLARNIDKKASPMVYSLLKYFVEYCFKDSESSSEAINYYMEALTNNYPLEILKTVLSYEYMKKQLLPERALIAKTLVSA